MMNKPSPDDTHQTKGRRYCRAVRIKDVGDHPRIVTDPKGFAPARIEVHGPGGGGWRSVSEGSFVIEEDGLPIGVLDEDDFFRHWEPIDEPSPGRTMRNLIDLLTDLVVRCEIEGVRDDADVEFWAEGSEYGHVTLGRVRDALDEIRRR